MATKRDRRRAVLLDATMPSAPVELKLITFGSPRHAASRCTYVDGPARFDACFDCAYNRGARGSGIVCAHRFGIDPTVIDGMRTQLDGDSIRWLDDEP